MPKSPVSIDQIMNPQTPTKDQVKRALAFALTITEAIRELGSVPSGHLYAMLVGKLDLNAYEALVRTLVNTGLVRKEGDLLVWAGPKLEAK